MGARAEDRKAERQPEPLPSRHNFYGRKLLTDDERSELEEAARVEGLEDEIAVLRVRLRAALSEQGQDLALALRGFELLVKAVAAQYRLSPRARKDLSDNFAAALNSLGDQILPADR